MEKQISDSAPTSPDPAQVEGHRKLLEAAKPYLSQVKSFTGTLQERADDVNNDVIDAKSNLRYGRDEVGLALASGGLSFALHSLFNYSDYLADQRTNKGARQYSADEVSKLQPDIQSFPGLYHSTMDEVGKLDPETLKNEAETLKLMDQINWDMVSLSPELNKLTKMSEKHKSYKEVSRSLSWIMDDARYTDLKEIIDKLVPTKDDWQ